MFMPLVRRTGTREELVMCARNAFVGTISATPCASAKRRCWIWILLGNMR